MAREPYAYKMNADGIRKKIMTKAEYDRSRFQAMGTAAAQRAGINKKIGGIVV